MTPHVISLDEMRHRLLAAREQILRRVESVRDDLRRNSLFDLRRLYIAAMDQEKLPYTEFDTKDKFIDILVFLVKRRLDKAILHAPVKYERSDSGVAAATAELKEIVEEWCSSMSGREGS